MIVSTASIENPTQVSMCAFIKAPLVTLLCATLYTNFILVAGHDRQRASEIFTLSVFAATLLLRNCISLASIFNNVTGRFLAAFFLLGGASAAMSAIPQFAIFEVSLFFLVYLLTVEMARQIGNHGLYTLRLTLQLVAGTGGLYALKFVVAYVAAICLGNTLVADDFTPGFSNIRFFNHTQTSTLPLLILLCCLLPQNTKLRWCALTVTVYWWLALFATSGRGTLMGMVAGCVVVALLLRRVAMPYIQQVAGTAALGLLAYFVLLIIVPMLTGGQAMNTFASTAARTASDPTSGRLFIWHRAAALIADHPLLGVGPMHFAHNAGHLHVAAHPHDWLMQIGSEWGLPALACLIAALALAFRTLLRAGKHIDRNDRNNQVIFTSVVMGSVAILVDGLVSGLFVMPQSQLAIALFLGCTMGWYRTIVPPVQTVASNAVSRLAGAVLVAAALAGIGSVWPDIVARWDEQPLTPAQQAANTGDQWPRLWKAGFF